MADIDINPFGEYESRPEDPTGESILFTSVGGSAWEPEREQEMSFGGTSQRTRVLRDQVEGLYEKLSQKWARTSEVFHFDLFELRDGQLYFRDKSKPLTTREGKLRSVKEIKKILGDGGLRDLGFDIPKGKLMARQASMLNRAEEELPSESDITKADDIELQEIVKNTEYLISQMMQTDDLFEHPLRELLGLNKQLRSIQGSLKVEVAKKVQLEERIKKENHKLKEFQEYPGVYDEAMREDISKQIDALNDELVTIQESVELLKGRLANQITRFKETITKVLGKDTSSGEKIQTLFREQGIMIASILTAIGMAISVLVEALLPGGGGGAAASRGNPPPPKDEKGLKEWIRSKLKALSSLLGKLGVKAAEALPGIIGGIISWILNRTKDVVGWVSQNLWALVVGIGGLIYTYMITK